MQPLQYDYLRSVLDSEGKPSDGAEGPIVQAVLQDGDTPHVSIHRHPQSGRPWEIHFMLDNGAGMRQKVAEFGPPSKLESGDVGPNYISLMAQWAGQRVRWQQWKNLILHDNGLVPVQDIAMDEYAYEIIRRLNNGIPLNGIVRDLAEAAQEMVRVQGHPVTDRH